MNPIFTVIIPYLNREDFLPRTLTSVLEQTLRPLQVVLVDNGSTDGSAEICAAFSAKHGRPDFEVVLLNETSPGAARARNTGLKAAKGRWVSFFDSDDEMSCDFLQRTREVLEREQCDVVAAATRMVFPDGREKVRKVFHTTSVADQILTGMLSTQSMVMRTDFVVNIDGWNADLTVWDDWELGVRILLNTDRLCWLEDEVFHRIYQHDDSLTGSSFSAGYKEILKAVEAVRKQLLANAGKHERGMDALCARLAILAGHLSAEHNDVAGAEVWDLLIRDIRKKRLLWFCKILSSYTRRGGRGAWFCFRTLWCRPESRR